VEFIQTERAPQAIGPYSQAVKANGMIYTSGQIALLPNGEFLDGTVEEQAEQVLQNLTAVLKAGESSLDRVVKTTIFLADMDDFAKINTIYESHFGSHKPARSTVAVKTLPKDALIEIEAVALI
jgi:2-iminobutanoate/2-iminopropanoate deaminase